MPFAVDPDRPLARSLARAGRGLVAAARDSLSHLGDDPVLGVHDARRDIRVSRAVLRLMRGVIGEEAYRDQQELLRRAAGLLSSHRDAHVLAGAFDRLLEIAGDPDPDHSPLVRAALVGDARDATESLAMAGASALLELGRYDTAIDAWPRAGDGLDGCIAEGFALTLRRLHKCARRAADDPTPEHLHELRKRSKDIRDQLRVLLPRSPARFGKLARRFDRVTDFLGEGRDQLLLADALEAVAVAEPDLADAAAAVRGSALARHAALAKRALAAAEAIDAPARATAHRLLRP
ncbi:MAG: CHAD domain-containing protein [Phycisphaerales bacterium]|nr:CHAD domain-containing protein [Phycisphaerales bacterium]